MVLLELCRETVHILGKISLDTEHPSLEFITNVQWWFYFVVGFFYGLIKPVKCDLRWIVSEYSFDLFLVDDFKWDQEVTECFQESWENIKAEGTYSSTVDNF